jgi:serine protease Do
MAGWKVAAITTAIVGAAGVGAAIVPTGRAQSLEWRGDSLEWWDEAQKAFTLISGSGSQIGVSIRDVEEADLKGQKAATGVVITDVETDSPAQKAGFRTGDIVVEFDGERVRSTRQFTRLVQETPVGRPVQAAAMRDGERVALTVTPREGGFSYSHDWDTTLRRKVVPAPLTPKLSIRPDVELRLGQAGRLGISVEGLSSQLADYFGTKEGVLVTSVTEASAAAKAGLKAGDVITSLNGDAATSAADFHRRVQRLASGDEFTLGIVRDKKPMTLKGKIESPAKPRRTVRTII